MIYKDKRTYQILNKHENKVNDPSSRSIRRQKEREVVKFGIIISGYVDEFWWDSLNFDDKCDIISYWNYDNRLGNPSLSLNRWIRNEYTRWKPNINKLRDNKIKAILDL